MRSTLDKVISWMGLALAALLLAGGGLLVWASNFINTSVTEQLSQQEITMPSGAAIEDPLIKPYLSQYAGQKMTDGDQAKAYADHYIAVHMAKASGGSTYEAVSGKFIAMTKDTNADPAELKKLGDLRQTLFMGDTLRGLLLNAYAFGTMAKIAAYAAWAAFVGAVVMAGLALLGLRHAVRIAATPAAMGVRDAAKKVTV
jgi:hypothetical protein